MGGTLIGGKKAAQTNLAKNPNHYTEIGRIGGSAKRTKPSGFAAMSRERVSELGRKGGSISKRRKVSV